MDRVRELAFLDYMTPNESWQNTISYLVELNASVRQFFVANFPFWVTSASPAAFSIAERTTVVTGILKELKDQRQYLRMDHGYVSVTWRGSLPLQLRNV